jgi:hypothetical protein
MTKVMRVLWMVSVLGGLVGIFIIVQAARKAPTEQELAQCAMMATACALVPYCLARAAAEAIKKS